MGKTAWARSHGPHFFNSNYYNLEYIDTSKDYGVFDDIHINEKTYWNFKSWFGGQHEFTATDKYKKKQRIIWGKPLIWCCNPASDPRNLGIGADEMDWLRESCVFAEVVVPMF